METELIREIEELAANAWPARVVQHVDGWRLRANDGVTGRANSVLPLDDGGRVPVEERLAMAEAFYSARGLPSLFQVTPASQPADLDAVLADRGYSMGMRVAVQTASLSSLGDEDSAAIEIEEAFGEEWFRLYCEAEAVTPERAAARREIYLRIGPRAGYAVLRRDGRPAAIGLGVLERGWIGLFSVATRPEYRRQGAATVIVRALAAWGESQGASGAYLQVAEGNTPALALYERLGFRTLYHYHYRKLEEFRSRTPQY